MQTDACNRSGRHPNPRAATRADYRPGPGMGSQTDRKLNSCQQIRVSDEWPGPRDAAFSTRPLFDLAWGLARFNSCRQQRSSRVVHRPPIHSTAHASDAPDRDRDTGAYREHVCRDAGYGLDRPRADLAGPAASRRLPLRVPLGLRRRGAERPRRRQDGFSEPEPVSTAPASGPHPRRAADTAQPADETCVAR